MGKDSPKFYRLIYRIIWAVSPKYTLHGTENLPDESCVLVGNHCQMYGPIAAELYLERPHYIWCIGEMMNRKEVPAYDRAAGGICFYQRPHNSGKARRAGHDDVPHVR